LESGEEQAFAAIHNASGGQCYSSAAGVTFALFMEDEGTLLQLSCSRSQVDFLL
jgi:hypothetical protein